MSTLSRNSDGACPPPGLRAARNWVTPAEIDGGVRPGTTTDDAQRLIELARENRELRRANEILKRASAVFAQAELDRGLE